MSRVYISRYACPPLIEYLESAGHTIEFVKDQPSLGVGVSSHPDLTICKCGAEPSSPIIRAGHTPSGAYPENAAFCAVVLERYLIHRLDITSENILKYARDNNLTLINVKQGYTKCGCVVVDGHSIITSDPGIISALKGFDGIDVLTVLQEHVALPGFKYGFLGGASGRVGNEIVFNGDLSSHPDFERICSFINDHGLSVRYFSGYELTDIGSIIESKGL